MDKKTFIVIMVDALDRRYLTPELMPFLTSLAKKNLWVDNYFPLAGFEHRHYIVTSSYPDEINRLSMYCKAKGKTKYTIIRPFWPILAFADWLMPLPIRQIFRDGIAFLLKFWNNESSKLQHIPFRLIHQFDNIGLTDELTKPGVLSKPTVFDVFRKHKIPFDYLWFPFPPSLSEDVDRIRAFNKCNGKVRFLHLSTLDRYGHKYGHGKETLEKVKEIDRMLQELITPDREFIIFGDHEMEPVKKGVNIRPALDKAGLVYFLDSTFGRFWLRNEKEKNALHQILNTIKDKGVIIDNKLRAKYHLKFKDNLFGDVFFVLKKGYVFHPDFFNPKPIKGMHGYLPEGNASTMIISSNKPRIIHEANEVDIAPTLLHQMGLPIPEAFSGKDLFVSKKGSQP